MSAFSALLMWESPAGEDTEFNEYSASGKYFSHKGHAIFYRSTPPHKDRQLLVLLHGFPTSSIDWGWNGEGLWAPLTEMGFDLIAPDFLGFGLSDKPPGHR